MMVVQLGANGSIARTTSTITITIITEEEVAVVENRFGEYTNANDSIFCNSRLYEWVAIYKLEKLYFEQFHLWKLVIRMVIVIVCCYCYESENIEASYEWKEEEEGMK